MTSYQTEKHCRAFEAILEISIKIGLIYIGYYLFLAVSGEMKLSDNSENFAFSLLLLPIMYTLRDLPQVIHPYTVKVEADKTKITVYSGIHPKIKDTLEYQHIDNYEVQTTILGRKANYSDVYLYSAGGRVWIPYLKDAHSFVEKINEYRTPLKK